MDYALAKELKDAGFPQNPHGHPERPNSWIEEDGALRDFQGGSNAAIYMPTFEELIGACGEGFGQLLKFPTEWEADGGIANLDGHWEFHEDGATPTDAVARLWLALNTK